MRNTFENVYRWIWNNNFVPYSISAEWRLIYDFIVRRLQLETSTTKVVVKATSQRTHLKLVSNS
jgi:hypothetical protein